MNKDNNNTSFWISYADLMAGLLFVFILLVGAIIIKYSFLETESKILEKTLSVEKTALEKSKKELMKKEDEISRTLIALEKSRKNLDYLKETITLLNSNLEESTKTNEDLNQTIKKDKSAISSFETELQSKKVQIELLTNLKLENKEKISELLLTEIKLKETLDLLNLNVKQKDTELDNYSEDILLKEKLIVALQDKNQLLDDELQVILERLKTTESKHSLAIQDLSNTKQKIKNLTGIKIKVITLLKNALGNNMQIDPKNGAISLSSNILFDEGQFTLKDNSKEALKNAVYDYFNTILENKDINKHIDKIIIEGHTNSKGSFLYNLELSQKRAYSVMSFLLDLDFDKRDNLKKLVVASGRSFLDPIYDNNGLELKDESRRIEIKFRLKNEDAIKEIESILDK
ncbi:OmpA family protein [Poseidonibacter lekithochrous]|uniref:OmpA family protein n=1 Tax=Poseidonibacter lekithochrous TaxID=1904463 RepID=UPI0008FC732B|nr:OmpA family protein [Poseidonibacter lekithochrous]QKJ22695.1 OmpA domain-containing protein [Poseidonibacter lekithochrous]